MFFTQANISKANVKGRYMVLSKLYNIILENLEAQDNLP